MDLIFIAKILILAVFIAGIIIFFGKIKKKNKFVVAGLCVIAFISSFISNAIVNVIPMPKDTVQLTATGKKNPEALGNEVSLRAVIVDGIQYEIQNAVEGKWFWKGNDYMWRGENDPRKPDGVTSSVTLEVPNGNDRKFVFNNNQYRGIVEISCNGESKTHDLYSENGVDVSIGFPGNGLATAFMIKLGRLALYALFIALILAYFVFVALKFDYDVIKAWFERNWDKVYYAAVALIGLVITFNIGKGGSLWYDEVWNLGWVYTSFTSIALWNFLQKIWFNIMPYGQEYLLLLPEIFIAFSVYIYGLIGSSLKSKRFGVILATLCASSPTILFQCSMEFRSYAPVILGMALTVYFFIKKQKEFGDEKYSTLILYGISIALAMDAHVFSLVAAGIIMIFDFVLIIVKKNWKGLIEFIVPAIHGIFWLFTTFKDGLSTMEAGYGGTWASDPTVKGVIKFIFYLCGSSWFNVILLIIGFAIAITYLVKKIKNKSFNLKKDYTVFVLTSVPFAFFLFIIIFSLSFDKVTLFIERYFTPIIIMIEILITIAVDAVIEFAQKDKSSVFSAASVLTISFCLCVCSIKWYNQNSDTRNNYKGIAQYIMSQNDIYLPSTACIVTGNNNVNIGFEYYLTHKGQRDSINHLDLYTNNFMNYDTIYVVYAHTSYEESIFTENGYKKVNNNTSLQVHKYVKQS